VSLLSRQHDRVPEPTVGLRQRGKALVRRLDELDLPLHLLALTGQQVLCTAPLAVAVSAVAERLGAARRGAELGRLLGLQGRSLHEVSELFTRSSQRVPLAELTLELVLAVLFASGVTATQQRLCEQVWGQQQLRDARARARQLCWAVGTAVYVALLVLGNAIPAHLPRLAAQGLLSLLFLWAQQHALLAGRVSWPALLPGASVVGAGAVLLLGLSPLVLPGQVVDQVADFGLIGAVFVLSVWLATVSGLIVGGAVAGMLLSEHLGLTRQAVTSRPRGPEARTGPGRPGP
jgi:membrane protein